MGWFSSGSSKRGDVSAREAQSIMCRFLRVNAQQIAADIQRGGAVAVRDLADHLEAGNIRRAR